MARAKTNLLTDVTTHEVSLVDRGAVKRRFAFRKHEDDPMYDEIIKACLETPLEDEAALDAQLEKRGVDKKAGAAIKGAIRLLTAFQDSLQDSHRDALKRLSAAPSADDDEDEDENGKKPSKKAADSEEETTPVTAKKDDAPMAMPPEIQAQFEMVRKAQEADRAEAVALRKELEERKDAEHLRECIAKAATQYRHLGPEKVVGAALHKLEKAGLAKDIEAVLRGANERAKLGGTEKLLKEEGTERGWADSDADTADARIQKAAVEVAKARNLPIWTAKELVCRENPALYEAYNNEQAQRAREGK